MAPVVCRRRKCGSISMTDEADDGLAPEIVRFIEGLARDAARRDHALAIQEAGQRATPRCTVANELDLPLLQPTAGRDVA
jgi:hypothetical protein